MRILRNTIACILILAIGGAAVWFIYRTEPKAQQKNAVAETAMLVETTGVEYGNFRPTLRALGTVEASEDITLSARVGGYVVDVASSFVPGSLVEKDSVLVELDQDDFRNQLSERRSALEAAQANLQIEQGRQDVARSDLELINSAGINPSASTRDALTEQNRDLVLREPQRKAAQSQVDAAEAALRQARLELERSRVRVPFNAQVLLRQANVGSQVAAGDALGRLVGTDAYWVVATLPQSRLRWLQFVDDLGSSTGESATGSGSRARVRDQTAWPEGVSREGRLLRPIGSIEEGTRLARVLVEVPDPIARLPEHRGEETLLLGAFVQVELEAREVTDVARVPRSLIRGDDTVWIMEDDKLQIREVTIVIKDSEFAYVSEGVEAGERLVVTNLASVVEGAALREEDSQNSDSVDDSHQPTDASDPAAGDDATGTGGSTQ